MAATIRSVLVALLVFGLSPAATGQEMSADDAEAKLKELNEKLKEAYDVLPKRYGADPAEEKNNIDKSRSLVDGVVGDLTGKHKSAGDAFSKVQANIARLNGQIAVAEKAQAVSAAQALIRDKLNRGEPASQSDWIAHDKAMADFSAGAGPGWQPVLTFFSDKAKMWREHQKKAEKIAAERKAAAEAAAKSEALKAAIDKGNASRKLLFEKLKGAEDPLPDEAFADLIAAANDMAAQDAVLSGAYLRTSRHLRVANAFLEDKKGRGEKVAARLEAGFVKDGVVKKNKLAVTIKAEPNWCYAVVLRDVSPSDTAVKDVSWSEKRKKVVQPFSVGPDAPGLYRLEGVCTTEKSTVKGTIKFSGKSARNALRYTTVGWPRADVPKFVTTYMGVLPPSRCAFEWSESVFTNPIPGSLAMFAGETHLITRVTPPTDDKMQLMKLDGSLVDVRKDALVNPSSEVTPAPTFKWKGCGEDEKPTDKNVKKLKKCVSKLEKSYASKIRRAEAKVEKAGDDEDKKEKAEAKLEAIEEKLEAALAKRCGPTEEKVKAQAEETFKKIVDATTQNPPKQPTDRVQTIVDEQRVAF